VEATLETINGAGHGEVAVEKAGLPGLNEGQVIEYEEVSNRGKTSAENLKVQR
jgi:cold shock CspA family protein